VKYKRDTNALVHWIIQTSRTIPSAPVSESSSEITVSTLLALSRIIAARVKPVPTTIYKLFQSVIAARSTAYAFYQQIVSENPSPEIEESNARHKAFLDALIGAFDALDGEEWVKSRAEAQAAGQQKEDEEDEAIFLNRFEGLRLPAEGEEEEEEEEEEEREASKENKPMRPKKGKGKAKAKGKKGKGKGKAPAKMPEPTFKEHPLEAYKLKDDSENAIADMLLAVYCFLKEMIQLHVCVPKFSVTTYANKLQLYSSAVAEGCDQQTKRSGGRSYISTYVQYGHCYFKAASIRDCRRLPRLCIVRFNHPNGLSWRRRNGKGQVPRKLTQDREQRRNYHRGAQN
jgi:hypothetical protein